VFGFQKERVYTVPSQNVLVIQKLYSLFFIEFYFFERSVLHIQGHDNNLLFYTFIRKICIHANTAHPRLASDAPKYL
jgi:hypothetical protein